MLDLAWLHWDVKRTKLNCDTSIIVINLCQSVFTKFSFSMNNNVKQIIRTCIIVELVAVVMFVTQSTISSRERSLGAATTVSAQTAAVTVTVEQVAVVTLNR